MSVEGGRRGLGRWIFRRPGKRRGERENGREREGGRENERRVEVSDRFVPSFAFTRLLCSLEDRRETRGVDGGGLQGGWKGIARWRER